MGGSLVLSGHEKSGSLVVSAVGQADDTALISNNIHKLHHILQIVLEYCLKYNVQLCPAKTKLLKITPARQSSFEPYNPIQINGKQIEFVDEAEHVGVLRSVEGNMPNILQRISAFKKALGSTVSCGLARGRCSNPAASQRILTLHGTPVLMSGLASLVLSDKEVNCIDQQYKRTLQNIIKLSTNTPASVVYFVSGSLPGAAILHLKQLTLFSMICRLPADPLNIHARQVLLSSCSATSWFIQVRNILLQYQLPHPLDLLHSPPSKETFKRLAKSKVLDYWECKLRSEASVLPSLVYFHPQFLTMSSPHKLWIAAGPKSYEVAKARIQLLFLSSQYPCAKYSRHWSPENPLGICTFPDCKSRNYVESPEHLLLYCPAYFSTRQKMVTLFLRSRDPISHSLATSFLLCDSSKKTMQFLLDCSVIPDVIRCAQQYGKHIYDDIFYLGRTWCFSIHRERMKRLGRWNFC